MSRRNTLVRSLHDLGLATWFGGTLMGAAGLNGAVAQANDPRERTRLCSQGWKRWAPVQAVAIGAHGIGGVGLIVANRRRVSQHGVAGANTYAKAGLTVAAAGLTAYSGVLGRTVGSSQQQGAQGATEPRAGASDELATAQQRLKVVQWAIPAVTGALLVMAAQQGEQQRPVQQLTGRLPRQVSRHL